MNPIEQNHAMDEWYAHHAFRRMLWAFGPPGLGQSDSGSSSADQNTTSYLGRKSTPASVAIVTFVVIVLLVIAGFAVVLYYARRRRRRMEAVELESERMRQEQFEKECTHVVVILPDNRLACAEKQIVAIEEEDAGPSCSGSSSVSSVVGIEHNESPQRRTDSDEEEEEEEEEEQQQQQRYV